jgi:hypothetical protein
MLADQSLAGRVKGLRHAVRQNDFKLAQRLRMALFVTLRYLDEPPRDNVARLVDVSGLWVRNVGDRHYYKHQINNLANDIVALLGRIPEHSRHDQRSYREQH